MAHHPDRSAPAIVGGDLRGRRLAVAPGRVTRPMRARLREALFAMLTPHLPHAHVLDLYAGSGALGIEALSRGAGRCTFVERDRHALRALRSNLQACGLGPDRAVLLGCDVQRFSPPPAAAYTLVLADPPFALVDFLPTALEQAGTLTGEAILALQIPAQRTVVTCLAGWSLARERAYGTSVICLYERGDPGS